MSTSNKKVSKKKADDGAKTEVAAPEKGREKVSKKKVAKKAASKKRTSKKRTEKKVSKKKTAKKEPKKITLAMRNKAIEKKLKGATIVGQGKHVLVNPRNIVITEGFNPRIDKGDLKELMASIKQNGVLNPIGIRKVGQHYELIGGERRLTCALKLAMKKIPAFILTGKKSESDWLALALIDNDAKPLAPVEEADAFRRLIKGGWTVRQISTQTGKRAQLIKDRLELISAHPDVAAAVKKGKLSVNLGIAIAKKVKGKRAQKRVVKKATSGREGRKKVAGQIGKPNVRAKFGKKAVDLQNRLNKLISIVNRGRKVKDKVPGQLVQQIPFFSKHADKIVRAAFVAGGVAVVSTVMAEANTKKKGGKRKKLTARGKQKK